jgi:transcriptional regulator with XRE-family HTH domain
MGFRENLKEQLNFCGIYVKELASLTGLKKKTIDSYLKSVNSSVPSVEAAVAIARVLGVSVEFLVNGSNYQSDVAAAGGNHASSHSESRLITQISAQLNEKDRKTVLALAKFLKKQQENESVP